MKAKVQIEKLNNKIAKLNKKIATSHRRVKSAENKIVKLKKNSFIMQLYTVAQIDSFVELSKSSNDYPSYKKAFIEMNEYHVQNDNKKYWDMEYSLDKMELYTMPDVIDTFVSHNLDMADYENEIADLNKQIRKIESSEQAFWESVPQQVIDFVDMWVEKSKEWHKINTEWSIEKIDKLLKEDRELKIRKFMSQIKDAVGEITDMSCLSIGNTGLINGMVHGTKKSVYVDTIGAGGYNIQCFHYRTILR